MHTWKFDLSQMTAPIERAGFHGLSLLLDYGENNPIYPNIVQGPTLRWERTGTTVTLYFESVDDVNRLMRCQLGDFRHGIGVVPGLVSNPEEPGWCLTLKAHTAICGEHFVSTRPNRSVSLGEVFNKKAPKSKSKSSGKGSGEKTEAQLAKEAAKKEGKSLRMAEMIAAFGPLKTTYNIHKGVDITATPHYWAKGSDAFGLKNLDDNVGLIITYHPALASWNQTNVFVTPQEAFLVSFSALAYVWVQSTHNEMVGLALDGETYNDVKRLQKRWCAQRLLYIDGDYRVALWTISAVLRLPENSYHALFKKGKSVSSLWRNKLPGLNVEKVYDLLDALSEDLGVSSQQHTFRVLRSAPVKVFKDASNDIHILDIVLKNLENRVPWWVGIGPAVLCEPLSKKEGSAPFIGLNENQCAQIMVLFNLLEVSMEKRITEKMHLIFSKVSSYYGKRFRPSPKGETLSEEGRKDRSSVGNKKARELVKIHLRNASNFAGIMRAIQEFQNLSTQVYSLACFDKEEFEWILDRAKKNPYEVQQLLMCSCSTNYPNNYQEKKTDDPKPSEESVSTPVSNDGPKAETMSNKGQ